MANDLAAGGVEHPELKAEQLYAGEGKIVTNHSVALVDIDKYEVCVLTATGLTNVFDMDGNGSIGTPGVILPPLGTNAVIAAQPALTGQRLPYFSGGVFNHEKLVWPAALDTLAKRKAFFGSSPIQIDSIHNAA